MRSASGEQNHRALVGLFRALVFSLVLGNFGFTFLVYEAVSELRERMARIEGSINGKISQPAPAPKHRSRKR